jgi:hypothetical protein
MVKTNLKNTFVASIAQITQTVYIVWQKSLRQYPGIRKQLAVVMRTEMKQSS